MRRYMFLVTFTTPDDALVEFTEDDIVMAITNVWRGSKPSVQAFSQNGQVVDA